MAKTRPRPRRDQRAVLGPARTALLLEREHIAELEVVFELYCELWEVMADDSGNDAHLVLDELARCGISDDLRDALRELRAMSFVESAAGTAADRDSMWFGLQIMLNQLLRGGKRLLSPEWLARAAARQSPDAALEALA